MNTNAWENAREMYARDNCAHQMGIEILEMGEGFARLSITVTEAMLNGHQICHGGQLFTLADTAFACACNSQGLAALILCVPKAGDQLTAVAQMRIQGKQTGVYDIGSGYG